MHVCVRARMRARVCVYVCMYIHERAALSKCMWVFAGLSSLPVVFSACGLGPGRSAIRCDLCQGKGVASQVTSTYTGPLGFVGSSLRQGITGEWVLLGTMSRFLVA